MSIVTIGQIQSNANYDVVHKFGRNEALGTTYAPIALGGIYRTPQPSNATKVRVKAGNVNDGPGGSGAWAVIIQGLNATGQEVIEEIMTNGTSAGPNSVNSFIRIYRAYVSQTGTYASASAGSHAADIVIENAAGTENWITISANGFPRGQSECGAYSVPEGRRVNVEALSYSLDATKVLEIILFHRSGILDTSPPYFAMRSKFNISSINNQGSENFVMPLGPFDGPCDIGVMGKVSATTTEAHVNFTILVENE